MTHRSGGEREHGLVSFWLTRLSMVAIAAVSLTSCATGSSNLSELDTTVPGAEQGGSALELRPVLLMEDRPCSQDSPATDSFRFTSPTGVELCLLLGPAAVTAEDMFLLSSGESALAQCAESAGDSLCQVTVATTTYGREKLTELLNSCRAGEERCPPVYADAQVPTVSVGAFVTLVGGRVISLPIPADTWPDLQSWQITLRSAQEVSLLASSMRRGP